MKILIIFLLLFSPMLLGQYNEKLVVEKSDSKQNHWVIYQYRYVQSLHQTTFSATGLETNLGFNVGALFSNRMCFGPAVDFKLIPGLSRNTPSRKFVTDFIENFIVPTSSSLDSANAKTIYTNMNNNGFVGSNRFYLGLFFSLFPQDKGGFLLQIKRGVGAPQARQNIYGNTFIGGGGNDKYSFSFTKMWQADLSFKPYALFGNAYVKVGNIAAEDIWKSLTVSVYYERFQFGTGEFNGTKVSQFVSSSFLEENKIDHRFGVKLGFSIY